MADKELNRLLDGFLDIEEEMEATKRNQNETNHDAGRSNPEPKYPDNETNDSLDCGRNFSTSKFPQETRVSSNHPIQISGQSYGTFSGFSTSDSVAGAQYSSFGASEESRRRFFLVPVVASRSDISRTDDNQQNLSSRRMEPKNTSCGTDKCSRTNNENVLSECLPDRKQNCFHSLPPPQMSAGREKSVVRAPTAENYRKLISTSVTSSTEDISNVGMTADRATINAVSAPLPSGIQALPNLSVKVKELQCEICGKFFSSKKYLNAHRKIHTGQKHCKKCGQRFTGSDAWREHILTHHEILHECSVCKKKFGLKSNLNSHSWIRTKEKPFTCDICKKGFAQKGNLETHYRIHSEERPYKCNVCGRGFTTKQSCTEHQKQVHDIK